MLNEYDRRQLAIDTGTLDYYMLDQGEPLLSLEEVAVRLGVHKSTVMRRVRRGDFTGLKVGRLWKFERADIQTYIDAAKKVPTAFSVKEK